MPYKRTRVLNYKYEFRSIENERIAVVYLFGDDDLLCMAVFTDNDEPITSPVESPNGHIYMAYKMNWFSGIIEMLRNEKPVYFTWNSDVQIASITTEEEQIGEEEKSGLLSFIFRK